MELPEYYKTVIFCDKHGNEHKGYLEPPFGFGDEDCLFFEEDSDDVNQGIGGIFYHTDDVNDWRYVDEN